jgi:flagellin-specific chaperone FliS
VRQKLDKEMTMIAALKQHYEHYHAGNLTALKKLYEYHAENCVKAAELTEDAQQREEYLKLAREWAEAARSAIDMNALDAKYRHNTRATDISDEMRAAVVEARGRSLRTSWSPRLSPTSP